MRERLFLTEHSTRLNRIVNELQDPTRPPGMEKHGTSLRKSGKQVAKSLSSVPKDVMYARPDLTDAPTQIGQEVKDIGKAGKTVVKGGYKMGKTLFNKVKRGFQVRKAKKAAISKITTDKLAQHDSARAKFQGDKTAMKTALGSDKATLQQAKQNPFMN